MKKIILGISLMVFLCISGNTQTTGANVEKRLGEIEQQLEQLQEVNTATQSALDELKRSTNFLQGSNAVLVNKNEAFSSRIEQLEESLQESNSTVTNLGQQFSQQKKEFNGQIAETRATTDQSVSELDDALTKNTLYWIIAVLALGILSILAFFSLRKRVTTNQSSITESLADTRRELEQEGIRLDEKLVGVMETQMKIIQEERKAQPEGKKEEQDHSLALKVADEIVRIEKNISRMDEGVKGLKQLSKAIERIKDNFASNGYEMVDMVGKPFDDGMKVTANFRPDDSLEPGQKIITRIIKPQVNYKGEMIQSAQVEVSQGD